MPAAYRAVSVSLSGTLVVLASTTLVTGRDIIANTTYRVDSVLPVVSARAEAAATGGPVPKRLRPFLELPGQVERYQRLREFIRCDGVEQEQGGDT